MADRQPSLARASRPRGENQLETLQFADIKVLRRSPGAHCAFLAGRNLLERRARRRRLLGKQVPLEGAFLDRSIDIAKGRGPAAPRPFAENLQHAARMARRLGGALDHHMIAIGGQDDIQPPLDPRQILVIMAKNHRSGAIVIQSQRQIRCDGLRTLIRL